MTKYLLGLSSNTRLVTSCFYQIHHMYKYEFLIPHYRAYESFSVNKDFQGLL